MKYLEKYLEKNLTPQYRSTRSNRALQASIIAACTLLLTGCPHHIEEMVEKMIPPKNHKPTYMTSSVPLSKYAKGFGGLRDLNGSTNATPLTMQRSMQFPDDDVFSIPVSIPAPNDSTNSGTAQTGSGLAQSGFNLGALSSVLKDSTLTKTLQKTLTDSTQRTMPTDSVQGRSDKDWRKRVNQQDLKTAQAILSNVLHDKVLRDKMSNGLGDSTNAAFNEALMDSTQNVLAAHNLPAQMLDSSVFDKTSLARPAAILEPIDSATTTKQTRKASNKRKQKQSASKQTTSNDADRADDPRATQSRRATPALAANTPPTEVAPTDVPRVEAATGASVPEKAATGLPSAATSLFTMDIRSVDDKRYPDLVELQAVIVDTAGHFVTGLVPKDGSYRTYWRGIVDSALQTRGKINDFRVEEVRETLREPNAIAFVLDHSGSMGNGRALKLQEAIRRTMNLVRPEDRIAVVKFATKIKNEVPLTQDSAVFKNQFVVDGLQTFSGGTALYDGAIAGIEEVAKAPDGYKKTVIVFSDGEDNSSKKKIRDVYRLANAKGVKLHTVAYGVTDEAPMENMAKYSGGRLYRIYSTREFPFVFADIYRSLKNYYRITYKPPQVAALHSVRVGVVVPELGNMRLLGKAQYDRSIVTVMDTVGAVKFVNIEFETGKASIQAASMPQIRDLATSLKQQTSITLEIRGHTDDRGGDELNQKLSEDRATSVAAELARLGVDHVRLSTKGFGKSKPIAPNDSEENRRRNRRTEFVITGGIQ